MRGNNPVFKRAMESEHVYEEVASASYKGVIGKTLFYILLLIAGAVGGIVMMVYSPDLFVGMLMVSIITAFISGIIALFSPRLAKVMGSIYSLTQGMVVGVVSLAFEAAAPGVVLMALLSTIVVLVVIATLFLTNIVKVNTRFMRFLMTFAISVMISMLFMWLLSITVYRNAEFSFGFNVVVSLVMIFLASLYILFDLENIRQVVEGGASKELEWYVSFGLVFTIVWMYMEILPLVFRLLNKSRN